MVAAADDSSFVEHNNVISMVDRGEAMCHEQYREAVVDAAKSLEHGLLRDGVH
mgnify:CR=1 FL=1